MNWCMNPGQLKKYFAAYNNTNPEVSSNKDLLSKEYLSEVLIDEDEKHTITIGSTLPLKEGYALKAIDITDFRKPDKD